jgi:hypothetical protein
MEQDREEAGLMISFPKSKLRIPIKAAKEIAEKYGYDQVIIYARKTGEGGGEHLTTYGRDAAHCSVAARIGEFLKYKVMGWTRAAA